MSSGVNESNYAGRGQLSNKSNPALARIPSAIPVPIAEGGTEATTAAQARVNLGIQNYLTALEDVDAPSPPGASEDGYAVIWDDATGAFVLDAISGSATWGGITGTLSNQTDLDDALDAKQDQDAVLDDLAGLTLAEGDLLYYDGSNLTNLGKGTAGQILTMNGGATAPEWSTVSGVSGSIGDYVRVVDALTTFSGTSGYMNGGTVDASRGSSISKITGVSSSDALAVSEAGVYLFTFSAGFAKQDPGPTDAIYLRLRRFNSSDVLQEDTYVEILAGSYNVSYYEYLCGSATAAFDMDAGDYACVHFQLINSDDLRVSSSTMSLVRIA